MTDPDSRIMKGRQGFVQGYNAQAVVTREQFVVACAVTSGRAVFRPGIGNVSSRSPLSRA